MENGSKIVRVPTPRSKKQVMRLVGGERKARATVSAPDGSLWEIRIPFELARCLMTAKKV